MPFYSDNSMFWKYLQNTLAWPQISEPGPLAALLHGIARYNDKLFKDILWLREQFVATKAESEFVTSFGQSRGVPQTRFDSRSKYRKRVERAFAWHKLAAKDAGLPKILGEYGFEDGKIKNLREDNPNLWAHFDVLLLTPPSGFKLQDIEAVVTLANEYKPGRSVLNKIQFAYKNTAPLQAGAVLATTIIMQQRIDAEPLSDLNPGALNLAAANVQYITIINELTEVDYE